jgi:hypothetical protein
LVVYSPGGAGELNFPAQFLLTLSALQKILYRVKENFHAIALGGQYLPLYFRIV